MKASKFITTLNGYNISAQARLIAQKAISTLNTQEDEFSTVETDKDTLQEICQQARIQPTVSGAFTFIRIHNEDESRSVDIQVKKDLMDTLGETTFKEFVKHNV